ncbi:hypothetical protein ACE6H2_004033 [Prunus campanulata]
MFPTQQEQIQNSNSCSNPPARPSPSQLNPLTSQLQEANEKRRRSSRISGYHHSGPVRKRCGIGKLHSERGSGLAQEATIAHFRYGQRPYLDPKEPIFDPSFSATYANVSCTSATCSQLTSATGNTPKCDNSTCIYGIEYGDQSFSIGYFGKEKLSLTNTDIFDGFLFGCGQNNQGLFGRSAGLLGLGRNPISLVEQLAQKYNRFFSYCLPSTSSSTGYLSFGNGGGSSNAVKFTPLSTVSQGDSYYGINVVGINVGGTKLPISASVFSSSGTIIDSGTVITRLPPTAYSALKAAFRQAMKRYPLTEAVSILDTCYDFSSFKTVSYPKISFVFDNGLTQDLDATGILYVVSADQVCLAFAGNEDDSDIGIFGNVQQKRLQVVYDIAGHNNNKASSVLKVVHKHGPCSKFHKSSKSSTTTGDEKYHAQILKQDQARVNSIHSRLNHNNNKDPLTQSAATTLPAKSGIVIGSANYIVTVSLGTPAKQLSLEFDTGSDLTWTQCRPCAGSCYNQSEPIFDPSLSASYKNISCATAACTQLSSSGVQHRCSASTSACIYATQYGDKSFTIGVFGSEKLTLTPTNVFEGFLFGCGLDNEGLFNGSAGLLGLGRSTISIVEQTANKYNRFFSYCLPSTSSSTGHLTFGDGGSAKGVNFTKLITSSQSESASSFYGLDLSGINVGGSQLSIAPSVFSSSGTIIDSGTVITRLPATAYAALRGAFREAMKNYTLTKSFSLFDTCYDISGLNTISYPKIAFVFGDGLTVDLDATGILRLISPSQICLAFAGNKDDSDLGIIGNVQQKRLEVVYDVAGGKVGFAPAGCP